MKDWIAKFIKLFYKDKVTVITYEFQNLEQINILARFLIHDRKIVNIDLYDIEEYGTSYNGTFFFKIKPKEDNTPPPPPKNTIENSSDNQPHRSSL
jgi:hypothetical protein